LAQQIAALKPGRQTIEGPNATKLRVDDAIPHPQKEPNTMTVKFFSAPSR
jgi:hypothetical protein